MTNSPAGKASATTGSKGRGIPFHGTIGSINKLAKTITLEGKKQRTFQVTPETKIHLGKAPATINSVLPGMNVGGYAREFPDGKLVLVTLNIKPAVEKPGVPQTGK